MLYDVVEEYVQKILLEQTLEAIKDLFEAGYELDIVLKSFPEIQEEVIRKIYEEVIHAENWGLDDPLGKGEEVFEETIKKIEPNILKLIN